MLSKNFKRKNLFFLFPIAILFVIFLIILISPLIIHNINRNWENELSLKEKSIASYVQNKISQKENYLLNRTNKLKNTIRPFLKKDIIDSKNIFAQFTQNNLSPFICQLTSSNGKLTAWSGNFNLADSIITKSKYQFGGTFFVTPNLIVFLSVIDTINAGNFTYLLNLNLPIEKKYYLQNKYYKPLSFSSELIKKFNTHFTIKYTSQASLSRDGRNYSFYIYNNFGNKLGVVTFLKPSKNTEEKQIAKSLILLENSLVVLMLLLFSFGFYKKVKSLNSRVLKFSILSLFLIVFRILLFEVALPSQLFEGGLVNPAYFSSAFAFGIVRTPLEFFITGIFFLLITLSGFFFSLDYFRNGQSQKFKTPILLWSVSVILIFIYFLLLRALGASIRSVVFDSNLQYFKEPSLLPSLPLGFMLFNVLIIGFTFLLISIMIFLFIFNKIKLKKVGIKTIYIVLFITIQIIGFIFDAVQKQPQTPPFVRISFITLTFILCYIIQIQKKKLLLHFAYIAFAASFLTVNILINYNSKLEKESVKITALNLSRPNKNWFGFLIRETFNSGKTQQIAEETFLKKKANYKVAAFEIWSNSVLEKETSSFEVNFLDPNKNKLGGFNYKFTHSLKKLLLNKNIPSNRISIFNNRTGTSDTKLLSGFMPVIINGYLFGYLEISIDYNINILAYSQSLPFMPLITVSKQSIVNLKNLLIMEFSDNKLIHKIGDINASNKIVNKITSVNFHDMNEKWLSLNFGGANYITYVLKLNDSKNRKLLSVSLKRKDISYNLFDFFKIFFIHTLIILLILLIASIFIFSKYKTISLGFRTQLLIAFLVISLIPLLSLAYYIRNLTEEKNTSAILYKLGKRAYSVEKFIDNNISQTEIPQEKIFQKAADDLNIHFTLYKNYHQIFSTSKNFYSVGLLPNLLNSNVYEKLFIKGMKRVVIEQNVENYKYNAFYYSATIGNSSMVIEVNDLFNKINLPISGTDFDVFLFGSYSFAVLIIIILSTLLANQISRPIRNLTAATTSVASGDLNISVKKQSVGEIKELIEGFNSMVKKLKKSQTDIALLERETAWKEMAKQVAHEIKNPLTPMKLAIQQLIIVYRDGSSKFKDIFEKVTKTLIEQIETLNNIASEFSNFARMPMLKLEKINLLSLINSTTTLFMEENIIIKTFSNLDNAYIEGDKDQLQRTLINLLRNAIQANATKIELSLQENENRYLLRIKDDGKGISSNIIDKIFDKNFTTKKQGMGLGLTMARRYLENIEGTISIEKTNSNGTTILIIFKKLLYNEHTNTISKKST